MSCVRGYASEHMALNTRHEGFVNRLGEMQAEALTVSRWGVGVE